MYIIVIGWLYVVLLMAATETSIAAGLSTLFWFGVLPVGGLLWLLGSRGRRARRQHRD